MAIILRNGLMVNFDPAKLRVAELAFVTDTKKLYLGVGDSQAEEVMLQKNMDTEKAERQAADEELQNNIDALRSAIGSPLVASTAAEMTDTNRVYVYVGSETGYANGHWYYYNGTAWADGGVYNAVAFETDKELDTADMAADAKATGDEIRNLKSDLSDIEAEIQDISGLSDEAKTALLDCFAHVAWIDDDGQDYYDALEEALYAQGGQLSATFTQGTEKYYPFDNLNSLKESLVVTYTDGEGQSSVVTNYTLSGSLSVGPSRITVGYNGLTAYFTVAVENVSMHNGAAIGKSNDINGNPIASGVGQLTARARFEIPIKNRSYTITVADSSKYNLAGYNLENNILSDFVMRDAQGTKTIQAYLMSEDVAPSWAESIGATGNYIWVSFKKLDGTAFTQSEIENAYGTIYTVS